MIETKIRSGLTRLIHRNGKTFMLFLLALLLSTFLAAPTFFTASAQTAMNSERKFTKMDLGSEPVEIVEIEVGGKATQLNAPFYAGDDWLTGTTIKFKNISRRTITYVNFGIDVKDEAEIGFLAGDNLIYGFRSDSKEVKRDEGRLLAAGNVAKVSFSSRSVEAINKLLSGSKKLKDINIGHLTLMMVVFDDGTKWSGGRYFRPDPDSPGKFIPENGDN